MSNHHSSLTSPWIARDLLAATIVAIAFSATALPAQADETVTSRPNILWITCEDMGPHLGCYGDSYAVSPNLDRFAGRSLRYATVWSNAPVCAPARTALISGMYPTSTGAEHMRSLTRLPAGMKFFPQYLRDAGYYCTNNSKEDYNLEKPGTVWDESSAKAHYRNRKEGQPFFAVFNFTITHESQIRARPHKLKHDTAGVRVPAYHPDLPEVRHDWAQYYDNITTMDSQAGRVLDDLEKDGLAGDTIVFFFSDHGSGMPRNKRSPYDSGLHVPLLVHFPERLRQAAPSGYQPGGTTSRLVSFVDFGPTVLSLAGIEPPETMQGQAFLGPHAASPSQFLHGFRGRMDERYDLVRSVRDGRYVYVRNCLPHLIYGQHLDYMFQTPTAPAWKKAFEEGRLTPEQSAFWKPKPPEELYDLESDRDEVKNLAGSIAHSDVLNRLRAEQEAQLLRVRDVGLLPEHEIHVRSAGSTPYDVGHDDGRYPLARIAAAAYRASSMRPELDEETARDLKDADSAVRYWGVLGVRMRGADSAKAHRDQLLPLLSDASPSVQIAAAEALAQFGIDSDRAAALKVLARYASFEDGSVYLSLAALNVIDALGERAAGIDNRIRNVPTKLPPAFSRPGYGIERLHKRIAP